MPLTSPRPARALGAALVLAAALPGVGAAQTSFEKTVTTTSGANAAAIQGSVDAFRASLGTLNANTPGSRGTGRREINWDGVPAQFSAPNNQPANFFNVNSPRGLVYSGTGTNFQVSANAGAGPVRFDNLNPQYASIFQTFSAQKLFTSVGSNVYDIDFFVPGTTEAATSTAFGAVFADVDLANTTSLEFFTVGGTSLGRYFASAFDGGLSFLGVRFDGASFGKIRVTNGNAVAGATDGDGVDVVVTDDFIYAEPNAVALATVPEPSTYALMAAGLGSLGMLARRRRRAVAAE